MNDQEVKRMIGKICPELDLSGDYADIMPRVTGQLDKLLAVAEQGGNAGTWSWMAVQFFRYGQQGLVAAHIDRLVTAVKDSYDAAVVLVEAPNLTDANRTALVKRVTDGGDAAWGLREAPKLTATHRDTLVARITDSYDAAVVLGDAPNLTPAHRAHLEKVAG